MKNKKERFGITLNFIKEIEGNKILELGCGTGKLTNILTNMGKKVTGLDVEVNEKLNKKIKIVKYDLNRGLPFKKNEFDVVIALEVLEHLYNPYDMMKEIKRVLKPEGYAIISMPNTDSILQRIGQLYEKRFDELNPYWHHYQPSIKSIRHLVSTQLKIEKEAFSVSFHRLTFLNFLSKPLLKISKDKFAGCMIIKASKN